MATILQPPQCFNLKNSTSISLSWKNFKQSWTNYEIASGVNEKDQKIRIATFLHVGGNEIMERYNGFIWKENENKENIEEIIKKFDEDLSDKTNIVAERMKFLQRKQKPEENCDEFVNSLRTLVSTCEYKEPQEALRDQFVLQIKSKKLQEKLLDQAQIDSKNLTFDKAVSLVKNFELTAKQFNMAVEESRFTEVNDINMFKKTNNSYVCFKCGIKHKKFNCPAYGKQCQSCGNFNHFKKQCSVQKKQDFKKNNFVKQVNSEENELLTASDTEIDEIINVVNNQ